MECSASAVMVDVFMSKVNDLTKKGIHVVLVFDGRLWLLKAVERASRVSKANEARDKANESLKVGDIETALKQAKQGSRRNAAFVKCVIDELERVGIEYHVSPFEADAQIAALHEARPGSVVLSAAQDRDFPLYGMAEVLYPITSEWVMVDWASERGLPQQLPGSQDCGVMCIFSGDARMRGFAPNVAAEEGAAGRMCLAVWTLLDPAAEALLLLPPLQPPASHSAEELARSAANRQIALERLAHRHTATRVDEMEVDPSDAASHPTALATPPRHASPSRGADEEEVLLRQGVYSLVGGKRAERSPGTPSKRSIADAVWSGSEVLRSGSKSFGRAVAKAFKVRESTSTSLDADLRATLEPPPAPPCWLDDSAYELAAEFFISNGD
mmetsp:Transcript_17733/g.45353  ORF Transcript_17733/g.45353 Transcript_17733/m.45353 type:complete len:385 (-) Transcript_17733:25-1179(-)